MKDKKVTLHSLRFGSETIHYHVSYRERRTLAINVHPDLQVEVIAPLGTTVELIRGKVRKRAGWIILNTIRMLTKKKQKTI
jgi:predicted metal-dependent hydrolase